MNECVAPPPGHGDGSINAKLAAGGTPTYKMPKLSAAAEIKMQGKGTTPDREDPPQNNRHPGLMGGIMQPAKNSVGEAGCPNPLRVLGLNSKTLYAISKIFNASLRDPRGFTTNLLGLC